MSGQIAARDLSDRQTSGRRARASRKTDVQVPSSGSCFDSLEGICTVLIFEGKGPFKYLLLPFYLEVHMSKYETLALVFDFLLLVVAVATLFVGWKKDYRRRP
jgi:hypothetical protein